jgi:beta-glucosidase-like glycosyl hydrolase
MQGSISDIHRRLAPSLVTGLAGTGLTPDEREMLSAAPPAGVILFYRNVESIEQLCRLTREIRAIVEEASGLPPLIMADHEGGRISVLARAIGVPPSQMAAWNPRSAKLLDGIVASTAFKMRHCGFNLNLSPVADVASEPLNPVIGTRSFGEDAVSVCKAVSIAVNALAREGIFSCLKHFPGHGATAFDSHLTLPVIGKNVEQLREIELQPFIAGIEIGADTVMTAHFALAEGGPPASLDRGIVTGLLRESLGFEGVIITDALEMAGALPDGVAMKSIDPAAGEKSGEAVPASIAARALVAGNDLLLMSRPLEEVYAELAAHAEQLLEAFRDPALEERMKMSAQRTVSLRKKVSEPAADSPGGLRDSVEKVRQACRDESVMAKSYFLDGDADSPVKIRGGPPGPALPVFLGDKADFDNYVVRRFIFRILEGLGWSGQSAGPEQLGLNGLSPVRTADDRETGLYIFEPLRRPSARRSLILLCRKPPPGDVVREIASAYGSVVAAGRPWDAALLPPGGSVVLTYGIYDMAADNLAEMLREHV